MKKYLKTVAAIAAFSFVVSAPAAFAANETTAKAKAKANEIKLEIKQKICEIKCKKDDTCKQKCGEETKPETDK